MVELLSCEMSAEKLDVSLSAEEPGEMGLARSLANTRQSRAEEVRSKRKVVSVIQTRKETKGLAQKIQAYLHDLHHLFNFGSVYK